MAAGTIVDWACLALDLGYADQAHFIRDFKKLIGRSPADYAKSLTAAVVSSEPAEPFTRIPVVNPRGERR